MVLNMKRRKTAPKAVGDGVCSEPEQLKRQSPQERDTRSDDRPNAEIRRMLEADFLEISAAVAAKGKNGDMAAARLVFDFLNPGAGERALTFELRRIESAEDAAAALNDVLQALAAGRITLNEAERIIRLLRSIVDGLDLAFFGDGPSRQAYRTEWAERRKKGERFDADQTDRELRAMSDDELNELRQTLIRGRFLYDLRSAAEEGRAAEIVKLCDFVLSQATPEDELG